MSRALTGPLSFGLSKALASPEGVGVVYSAEAAALFARFTTPPDPTRKLLIDSLIVSLKTAGVWPKLDALYLTAAADSQAARRNWVADQYNLTAVSSPTFLADRGYTGDGAASDLDTSFNATTAVSPKFTQNSASMALWSRTNLANGAGQSLDMGAVAYAYVARSGSVSGRTEGRPIAGSGQVIAAGGYPGHSGFSRDGAALWEGYGQGADAGGGTTASIAPTNTNIRILSAGGGAYGLNQVAAAHFGSALTAANMTDLYNALNTYLQAVGAA